MAAKFQEHYHDKQGIVVKVKAATAEVLLQEGPRAGDTKDFVFKMLRPSPKASSAAVVPAAGTKRDIAHAEAASARGEPSAKMAACATPDRAKEQAKNAAMAAALLGDMDDMDA